MRPHQQLRGTSCPSAVPQTFDLAGAMDRVAGDRELFRELAQMFVDTSADLLAEIEQALAEGNGDELTRWAHTLKGSVSNFCASESRDLAARLEVVAARGDLDAAADLLPSVTAAVAHFAADLSEAADL
jgi:HPt (histidine-containing phosphotransfer) domain-containing protein